MVLVQEYRWNRIENPETDPVALEVWDTIKVSWGKRLSNKWCWPSRVGNDERIFFSLVIRINSKWTRNLNVKMKQVLEKIWVNFLMYDEWVYVSKSKGKDL